MAPPLCKSLRKRLTAYTNELPGLEQGRVGAVHRARVATRRLREALRLLDSSRATTDHLCRRLRKVTKELGDVRELDVLAELLEEMKTRGGSSPEAVERVAVAVNRERDRSRAQLGDKLGELQLHDLGDELEEFCSKLESADGNAPRDTAARARHGTMKARLAHRAGGALVALAHAGTVYVPRHLHAVRIALKKLRYAAEFQDEAEGRRLAPLFEELKAAQSLLGRLHDLEGLLGWVREVQASLSPPDLKAWRELRSVANVIEEDCCRLHASFLRGRSRLIAAVNRLRGSGYPGCENPARRSARR